ncbi:hypothetical protein E4T56_gene10956 [Termitomyces sp. T112]|nr:hypothetical protein E4T56_gene10956 [Termitomyces sp. T112]KAH0581183.1 hypothetical protein H2248_012305 [Termitomyces sp. 'cryptogamus']
MSLPTTISSISSTSSSSSLSTPATLSTSTSTSTTTTTSPGLSLPLTTSSVSSTTTTTATEVTNTATSTAIIATTSSPPITSSPTFTTTSTTSTAPLTTLVTTTRLTTPSNPTAAVSTSLTIVTVPPTLAPPRGSAAPATHNGFFANKGAVAGVFTVVGLVVVGIIVAFIIIIIRRRRAKQFDREVEAAAAEAAAAPAPDFLDDDDDPYRNHGDHATTYTDHQGQYSDISSHGTYSQPPLGLQEVYNMRELGPGPGEIYTGPYVPGGTAGAAGVGVARARSTRDPGAFASGFQEGSTPYPAFAGPAAFHSGAYGTGNGGVHDFLDTGVEPSVTRGMSLNHHQGADYGTYDHQQHSQGLHPGQYFQQSDLARNPSQATYNTTSLASSMLAGSPAPPPLSNEGPSYAAHYASVPVQEAGENAHGGYTDEPHGARQKQEDRQTHDDDDDDEDEDEGRPRVLKVANE